MAAMTETTQAGPISLTSTEDVLQYGDLTVRPMCGGTFGAEVSGIDWKNVPLPEATVKLLVELIDQYAVLIFRETGLDNDGQVAFSAQLGELEQNPVWGGSERVGSQYLFDVSNIEKDGTIVKKGTRRWAHSLGNALWHTDSSFNQHRSKYSLLLSHTDTRKGDALTYFADTRQAFKDLPLERQEELRKIVVEHELWHSRKLASPDIYGDLTPEERGKKPPSFHHLVQKGPSGSETFFLAAHAKNLYDGEGKLASDSQRQIWDLIGYCTQEKYTFSVEWGKAGTMIWWDNRQSMHRASEYSETMGLRDVRRATVIDDGPLAFGLTNEEIARLQKE